MVLKLMIFLCFSLALTDFIRVISKAEKLEEILNNGNYTYISIAATHDIKQALYCPEAKFGEITFPRSAACSKVALPCSIYNDTDGYAIQHCDCKTGKWLAQPNLDNCTHKWTMEFEQAISNNEPAEILSGLLADKLKSTIQFRFSDIVGSVNVLENLIPLAMQQYVLIDNRTERSQKAIEFTQRFGAAGDELLSSRVEITWMQLGTKVRIATASTLMISLERSAALMATFLDQKQKKINYSNWGMQVQVKSPGKTTNRIAAFDDSSSKKLQQSLSLPHVPHDDHQNSSFNPELGVPLSSPAFYKASVPATISFSDFQLSPVISLPSLEVLQQSTYKASASAKAATVPYQFNPQIQPRLLGTHQDTTETAVSLDRNPLRLGYYIFKSFGNLLNTDNKTIINSLIIGASVNNPTQNLELPKSNPVSFTFYHIKQKNVANPRCVFWDTNKRIWNESGCSVLQTSINSTDCLCTHLTSFAILMDIIGEDDGSLNSFALNVISILGCSLSAFCLFLTIVVLTCFRSLWNVRHSIHRNLCICLLLAELIFLFGIDATRVRILCSFIAIALHYLFLSAFCWMLLEGYQLYLMLIQVFETDETKIFLYYLFGYGFSAIIVAISAGISFENYGTINYCWLNAETPIIWSFVGPISFIIFANLIFLFAALKAVLSVKNSAVSRSMRIFGWLKGSTMLLCLLGITWTFGYLMAIAPAKTIFAYIFTLLNCLQGVFIFIFHVVMNEKVGTTVVRSIKTCICGCDNSNIGSNISSQRKFMKLMKGDYTASKGDSHPSSNSTGLNSPGNKSLTPQDAPLFTFTASNADKPNTYSACQETISNGLKDNIDKADVFEDQIRNSFNSFRLESEELEGISRRHKSTPVRRKKDSSSPVKSMATDRLPITVVRF